MELSLEERNILTHVVVDPDAWLAHAVATFGKEVAIKHLKSKVDRWKPVYITESAKPDYKNRAERDAIEAAAKVPTSAELSEQAIKAKMVEISDRELRVKAIAEIEAENVAEK